MYAGTERSGIYRSADGGKTWTAANVGLVPSTRVVDLVVSPAGERVLAVAHEGLFESLDHGASWQPVLTWGVGSVFTLRVVQIDPSLPTRLYGIDQNHNDFLRSDDGGRTWIVLPYEGVPFLFAWTVAGDGILYAVDHPYVLRSLDHGMTWEPIGTGLPEEGVSGPLAVDPLNPARLVLASSGRYFHSEDRGLSWTEGGNLSSNYVFRLTISRQDPQRIYAIAIDGLRLSIDGGVTFGPVPPDLPGSYWWDVMRVRGVAEVAGTAGTVLVAPAVTGPFRSTDGGGSWASSTVGFEASWPSAIVVGPAPDRLLAGMNGDGLYLSDDRGGSWRRPVGFPLDGQVSALAVAPSNEAVLYVAASRRVFRSRNAGEAWAAADGGLEPVEMTALAIDPANEEHVLALAIDRAFWSENGGDSWVELVVPAMADPRLVNAVLVRGRELWAIVAPSSLPQPGIFRFRPPNESWQFVPLEGPSQAALAVSGPPPSRVYLLAGSGVHRSDDQGATWTFLDRALGQSFFIAGDPRNRDTATVGGPDGFFRTVSAGDFWFSLAPPPSPPVYPIGIAVGLHDPARMLTPTLGQGVQEFVPEPLFADGFETGDSSAWSGAVP